MITELFKPMKIGNVEIKNRLVVPPMVTQANTTDGFITDRYIKYMEEKAKGGWGLIITEDYIISPEAGGYTKVPGLWMDEQIVKNRELTAKVHEYGAKIFCQIYHAGKQKGADTVGQPPVAPSAIKDPQSLNMPREITKEEIHKIVKQFGETARRVKEAGFDGVEIHAAHGYLISQFLSFFINKRTDEYGGCFENRCRFFDEIYYEIRKNVGTDFPVTVRFSVDEYVVGGRHEKESLALARHFSDLGVDALHISNGVYATDHEHHVISNMFSVPGFNADNAAQIKSLVDCPIILVNRLNDPDIADTMIKMGKADFIAIGRGSLADPDLPKKVYEKRFSEINYCIMCLEGCEGGILTNHTTCLVNPRCVNEIEASLDPVEKPKNVLVVGAGPAGLMAARTAAQRGHKVSVYDKDTHFGGVFRSAAYPIGKGHLSTVISSYRAQCERLGVKFNMGCEVTPELLKELKPEAIVLATGSRPLMPNIPGIEGKNVFTAEDILLGNYDVKDGPVVVCGGGEVGGETAEFIAEIQRDVTILEMKPQILTDMFPVNMTSLVRRIHEHGIKVVTNATVSEITETSVSYKDAEGNIVSIPADTVVSAFGYRAYNPLEEAAKAVCNEVYTVGSCVKAGGAMVAIKEGYEAGLKI